MTSVDQAARDAARAKGSENKARAAAIAARRLEAVLSRRERGMKIERIAAEVRLGPADVRRMIDDARKAGDPRALTGRQTALRVGASEALDALLYARAAAPQIPAESADLPDSPRSPGVSEAVAPLSRMRFVNGLRDMADECRTRSPKASGGLHHLADLHEHCDRFYPSLLIPSQGTTIEETDRRFPRHALPAMSSPAQLCVEG